MTKLLCLLGSPRARANSTALARRFASSAEAESAEVQVVKLAELAFSGCRNLFHCKTAGERCGQNDDLSAVLDQIHQADI